MFAGHPFPVSARLRLALAFLLAAQLGLIAVNLSHCSLSIWHSHILLGGATADDLAHHLAGESHCQPAYPAGASQRHSSGTVMNEAGDGPLVLVSSLFLIGIDPGWIAEGLLSAPGYETSPTFPAAHSRPTNLLPPTPPPVLA